MSARGPNAMMEAHGGFELRGGDFAHLAGAGSRPDRELFYSRLRPHERRGQGRAQEPQTLWRGARTDDGGAGMVCRAATAGIGEARPVGDCAVAALGPRGPGADG